MKKIVATLITLTALTANAITTSDLMTKRDLALTAFGVAEYYENTCAGLTSRGQRLISDAYYTHEFNKLSTAEFKNTKEFKYGYNIASKYTCTNLRRELTNAGAGALVR